MKKIVFAAFIAAAVLTACGGGSKPSETTALKDAAQASTEAVTYTVDATGSKVAWLGKKLGKEHNGTIQIKNGTLSFQGGKLQAGTFTIDMNTIKNLDLAEADGNAKLVGHLASPDFFDAAKYPEATFEITSVTELSGNPEATHEISGNLTIKGKTNGIKFPAKVETTESGAKAIAKIVIDRTQYDVMYGALKTIGDKMADQAISDNIEFNVELVANK